MGNDAFHVIGFRGSGDKISLFLQDWELAKVALKLPHGPGSVVPGNVCCGKEMWLVWVVSGPVGLPDESLCHGRKKELSGKPL